MADILIGWELGAYGGHLARIQRISAALAAAGHRVTLALQRVDAPGVRGEPWAARIWQAPLWPSLLARVGPAVAGGSSTLSDILASAGLARPGTFARMLAAWEPILDLAAPDVVIGDYAPALLCAARGHMRIVAVSDAFDLPPPHLSQLPSFTGRPPLVAEAAMLEEVNGGLAASGRPPLPALAALFAADLQLPLGFPALDPFSGLRDGPVYRPFIDEEMVTRRYDPASAPEVFVYWPGTGDGTLPLWQALARLRWPVRVHAPQLTAADHRWLAERGFIVEPLPVPYPLIAERSRLLISHGGVGFASTGAIAGLPQLVLPLDLQKQLIGEGLARTGAGAVLRLDRGEETILAAATRLADDPGTMAAARALAETLRAAPGESPVTTVVDRVGEWTR